MKKYLIIIFCFLFSLQLFAQQQHQSPYNTDFWKDGAAITAGVGMTGLGFLMIQNKDDLTEAEVRALSKDDVIAIDRWAAGYTSDKADELSYIPFYTSFGLPVLFLVGEHERNNFGQISVLFVETMAVVGAAFTLTAGAIQKSRPLVYNESLPMDQRKDKDAQRSFIGGHTAATAAATFFTAKVFSDFNPDSKALPYIWAGAGAIPAFVGYLRTISGKHFLSDNIVGLVTGAVCGVLIPEIHKKGNENLDVYPSANLDVPGRGLNSQGLTISYKF